jgi:TATA-binding protein-associated factor
VRRLTARHRLILSGTPIQNNVTELWALFDFLLPGYLGTERQFHRRYARPILQSRETGRGNGGGSAGEQEAGVLALEALHRQTLPFILRRMKAGLEKTRALKKKTSPVGFFFLVFLCFLGFFGFF